MAEYNNEKAGFFDRFWRKTPLVRTCPHCGVQMSEENMMKHVSVCYSSSFRVTANEFHSEYRGSVGQMTGAVTQLENDYQKRSLESTNRNKQPDPNMSVGQKPYTKFQNGVDGTEQADEFHSEYRGPVNQMTSAMRQVENDSKKKSSASTNSNKQADPNMFVGQKSNTKLQDGVDGTEQAPENRSTDKNSIHPAQKSAF